eukprot:1511436-Pyramimonas_sp.AAC.1
MGPPISYVWGYHSATTPNAEGVCIAAVEPNLGWEADAELMRMVDDKLDCEAFQAKLNFRSWRRCHGAIVGTYNVRRCGWRNSHDLLAQIKTSNSEVLALQECQFLGIGRCSEHGSTLSLSNDGKGGFSTRGCGEPPFVNASG